MATVLTVLIMGAKQVFRDVEEAVVVAVIALIMIVVVAVRGGCQMLMHGMPRRPDGLEGDEPHEEDQERTTHGAR